MKRQGRKSASKRNKSKSLNVTAINAVSTPISIPSTVSSIEVIAEKRTAGAETIKGFIFQCQYAVWKILAFLTPEKSSETRSIRLEGIEDIDANIVSATDGNSTEYIQVKAAVSQLKSVTKFWDKGALQNFAEVYLVNKNGNFRLIHSTLLATGYLTRLAKACEDRKALSKEDFNYWQEKFDSFEEKQKADVEKAKKKKKEVGEWNWAAFNLADFLKQITFEEMPELWLIEEIHRLLITNYDIASGNEGQYFRALHWQTFLWSRKRANITYKEITQLIEEVKEDIAKGAINPAVQGKWLEKINFESPEDDRGIAYFEGKAARPIDIFKELPAKRDKWEREILNTFHQSEVTVIRASSGQGKSTLAWQVTLQLVNVGWTPYELVWCGEKKEIGNIIRFIESRLRMGELPLIIIDGLNYHVFEWAELAKRTNGLPVKYIVTTREEDWYRFGADRSQLRLIPINIQMTREEAHNIFKQFKKAGNIQSKTMNWQSAWERVEERGLLIEYVYLLTRGEMMEERLAHQIRVLAEERNADAKLEILRLVSVADLCGVQLITSELLKTIRIRIGFQGDRGELLKNLQLEYYIQFQERTYIEGLHPIRSQHLSDILHETLSLVDTLSNLLPLIDPHAFDGFCAHAPLMVEGEQRHGFLQKLAQYIATRSYSEIVSVIDGLFSTDALQHWRANQNIYDDMYARGLLNELFVLDAFPWSGLSTYQNFSKIQDMKALSEFMLSVLDKMTPFQSEFSDTFVFIKALSACLPKQKPAMDFRKLGRLILWFHRFSMICPVILDIDESQMWQAFHVLELNDGAELFTSCHLSRPDLYQSFIEKYKTELISSLKKRTKTFTIQENDQVLQLEYLLDEMHDSNKSANEQSVERVRHISAFLPIYDEYHIRGIQPSIPGLAYYTDRLDESVKQLKPDNINNPFRVHLNTIWVRRVMGNYECLSVYDWQKQWYDFRKKSLTFVMEAIRFFESLLEGDDKRTKSGGTKIDLLRPKLMEHLSTAKKFPKRGEEIFQSKQFNDNLEAVDKWIFPWSNFLNQMIHLIASEDEHKISLASINIQDTRRKLNLMQDAYEFVLRQTFPHFDTNQLKADEIEWFNRLSKTIDFYVSVSDSKGNTPRPKNAIIRWWEQRKEERIENLKSTLVNLEKILDCEFIPPTTILEKGVLLKAIIGIKGLTWERLEEKYTEIFVGFSDLVDSDIDYFVLIPIEEDHTENAFGFSIPKDFLKRVEESIEEEKTLEESELFNPSLTVLEPEMLETLPGIFIKEDNNKGELEKSAIGDILLHLWRLAEIRQRLSEKEKIEVEWRHELERDCKRNIDESLSILRTERAEDISSKYQKIAESIIDNNAVFAMDDFQRLLNEDLA